MGSRLDASSSAVRKRIQNHSFEDEEGEEYGASAFGGFGDYFRRKKAKLQNLDLEIRSSAAQENCPPIFQSVVAYVNGYTQPSIQDLHRLIVRHGGGFLQYLDGKTAATHIIASSLTPKKRVEFRRYRVVKPAWVVESVKAGRLLPWDKFRLVDEGHAQKVLKFDSGRMVSQTNNPQTSYKDHGSPSGYTSQFNAEKLEELADSASSGTPKPEKPSNFGSQSDYGEFPSFPSLDETPKPTDLHTSQEDQLEDPGFKFQNTDVPTSGSYSPSHITKGADISVPPPRVPEPPKQDMTSEEYNTQLLSDPRMRNSSVTNPEFIQQYYQESRLHHLSTWKAELKTELQSQTKEKFKAQLGLRNIIPGARRYIMHVDFDCFFAAVSTLKHPELAGKPVAIAHGTGTGSEIASCNYPARELGVKNGMWMKAALQACPGLQVLPYDFPAYENASRKFYSAILSVDGVVQSVSIDEALVDITSTCLEAGGTSGGAISEGSIYREQARADEIADRLRDVVRRETGCAVSVGIGGNILLAKVALRKAKPAGQFHVKPDAALDFIGELEVQKLPGVGYSMNTKLEELGVKFVKDIRELSRERLTSALGPKTGAKLWDYSRGVDRAEVGNEVVRKSVSAEVNWGIRFVTQDQADGFVRSLCEELHRRLVENLVKGKQLTIKVMRRSSDAPLEPAKHLGHGKCDVINRSVVLGVATNAADVLGKEAVSMLRSFGITPGDLRGLGVQMTKLEPLRPSGIDKPDGSQQQLTFKTPPARKTSERRDDLDLLESPQKGEAESIKHGPSLGDGSHKPLNIMGTQFIMPSQSDPQVVAELPNDIRSKLISQARPWPNSRAGSPSPLARRSQVTTATLPPQSQLDPESLAALPEDLRAEILGYYNQQAETTGAVAAASSTSDPRPVSAGGLKVRKPATPTKKRRGRPSSKASNNGPLTQSKFVLPKSGTPSTTRNACDKHDSSRQLSLQDEDDTGISAEFLAALPEDIRREVLDEQRRSRLLQRPSNNNHPPAAATSSSATSVAPAQPQQKPPVQERQLRLPPLPERPTFTSKKLSSLSDLRDAVSSWHRAFAEDGPFDEDVKSLREYLKRVVVEEKDVDKAVSVTQWLMWLIDDGKAQAPHGNSLARLHGGLTWDDALRTFQLCIQEALTERGLPPVDFS